MSPDVAEPHALVFVYHAESGLFNAVSDIAHKALSPETYACRLCALTHRTFGMRTSWRRFLEALGRPLEFLHADELRKVYGMENLTLPAILTKEQGSLRLLVDATAINRCQTLAELQQLVTESLR